MLPSLASLGIDTDAKRKLDGEVETTEERYARLFREFLATPPQGPTFDGSSIDPAALLADTDKLLLGRAVEDDPDGATWARAMTKFVSNHTKYAEHSMDMIGRMNEIGEFGLNFSYVRSWPSLSSWSDEELRFARFAVERAFQNSMERRDLHSMVLGPQTFHLMPANTFWSLFQSRRTDGILTIRDVLRMRSTNTAIAVIPSITQNQGSPNFEWLTGEHYMFGTEGSRDPQLGYFYPFEPWKRRGTSVEWEDYARLEATGNLDRLLDAYAVTGTGADYWVKLSPELIGLAYGWMAQAERAFVNDVETHGLRAPIPSRMAPTPSWLRTIEQDEDGTFTIPDAVQVFGDLALAFAKSNIDDDDSDEGEGSAMKQSKTTKSSREAASAAETEEEPIGTVQTDENGFSFVKTSGGERLFFENYVHYNPYRGLGSQSRSNAMDGGGEIAYDGPGSLASLPEEATPSKLYFRLDRNGEGMWDNSTDEEAVGHVFPEGTRVTYTRRLPSQLKQFRNGKHNAVAMYHLSNSTHVSERLLPDKFDGFAFRVKAV